ncbi:MAG: dihydroorotate dehydrogenase electron transfer subunit [Deltaproteobacteria bacterium]
MPLYDISAELVRCDQVTASIYLLTFRENQIARNARPGQFVMVRTGSSKDPLLRRPFSIHQVTQNGDLLLLVRVVGSGTRLLSLLEVGERVQMLGPLGNCFDLSGIDSETTLVALVGGGMGVAPLLFLASDLVQKNLVAKTKIILGARFKDELLCLYSFKELGFSVQCITDDGSSGQQGFVTDLLRQNVQDNKKAIVFSCGPAPMLKAVSHICEQNGTSCQISLETFMACGISACLGCAVPANRADRKYLHVCKNGPVFDSREIAWDQM